MNWRFRLIFGLVIAFITQATLRPGAALGETRISDPVGFVRLTIPAFSDVRMGLPLHRPVVFEGSVQSISGQTITAEGTPNWLLQQFTSSNTRYYVRINSGIREGQWGTIITNDANSVGISLDDGSDNLNGIAAGEGFSIIPHWTPQSFFPTNLPEGLELYLYDNTIPGINHSPSTLGYHYASPTSSWVDQADYVTSLDHRILPPNSGLVVRNSTNAPVPMIMTGNVPMFKNRVVLRTITSGQQDHQISYTSPVPEYLVNLSSTMESGDFIFLYNNAATGYNKSPHKVFAYWEGVLYDEITFGSVSEVVIEPGSSFLVRKAAKNPAAKFTWESLPSYLQP